jgi:hypothetical protein
MRELVNDPFYELIKGYGNCIIDYCIIGDDTPYQGYRSHKDAVLFAMLKVIERWIEETLKSEVDFRGEPLDEPFLWSLDMAKAKASVIDPGWLLRVPKVLGKDPNGNVDYDCRWPDALKGDQIPYWYAFIETVHTSGYGPEDFRRVNEVLFPNGPESLEAMQWTTDWSSYFDDGHEWWGTACWSVYDRSLDRYVVIMASATD